jgi:hypothetical protein
VRATHAAPTAQAAQAGASTSAAATAAAAQQAPPPSGWPPLHPAHPFLPCPTVQPPPIGHPNPPELGSPAPPAPGPTTVAPGAPVRPLPALSAGPGISQTVPFAAREQWATKLVRLVDALLAACAQAGARNAKSASAQTGARNAETALDNLLALPARALAGRTRADACRTQARLERLHDTDTPEALPAAPTSSLSRNRPEHHRTASRIHRCLVMGSISRGGGGGLPDAAKHSPTWPPPRMW